MIAGTTASMNTSMATGTPVRTAARMTSVGTPGPRHIDHPPTDPPEFLSRDACAALFQQLSGMMQGGGELEISLVSQWIGSAQWVRNRIQVAVDQRTTDLWIRRSIRGADGSIRTSRLDSSGLRDALRTAEANLRVAVETPIQFHDPYIDQPILHPTLFSDDTYHYGADARTAMVQQIIAPVEAAGLMSAGTFTIRADGHATMNSRGMSRYYPTTSVEYTTTVRDSKGTASGWAGVNHYDVTKIDPAALGARALEKAQASLKPQAIEPGRYTVVLEPQATADLFGTLAVSIGNGAYGPLGRSNAEQGNSPFAGHEPGWTKISEAVLDARLTMSADPMDPDGGFIPFERYSGEPFQPVRWIDRGMLRELAYDRHYALSALGKNSALLDAGSFRLAAVPSVPTSSIDDMIAKTERGIVVTRFSGVEVVDVKSQLCTGFTRDGLWLIERGKISRAIKNLRFTESPLFMLNRLLDVGPPIRVFKPGHAWIAPAVRVDDFSFTALADAV